MDRILKSTKYFEKVINNVHSAVIIMNSDKKILYINSNVGDIFELDKDLDLMQKMKSCKLLNCINQDNPKCPGCELDRAIKELNSANDDITVDGECTVHSIDREPKFFEFNALNIRIDNEKLIFLALNDITEKKRLLIELEHKYKELEQHNVRLTQLNDSLENSEAIIVAIANSVEAKDKLTKGHIHRVKFYTRKVGQFFKLSDSELEILEKGAVLHDIGKIGTPDHILNKPGKLTPEEFEIMKQHPVDGDKILAPLKSFSEIKNIVRHHHEKLDGSGYPDGLKGDEINLFTRIVGIVDMYDALRANRPYREGLPKEAVFEILDQDVAKGLIDGEIVNVIKEIAKDIHLFD